jgi:hypothetical protein
LDVLKNFITSLNGNSFSWLHGFGMMVDFNTSYYVADFPADRIYLLNDNYEYVTHKIFSSPAYMVTINSSLYITGFSSIWKTDKYLNVLQTYTSNGAEYRGIYFNSTEKLIHIADRLKTYFQVLNMNLSLEYTVNLSPYCCPYSFSGNNNELYIGTMSNIVLVVVNKVIIRSFTACSTHVLNYIFSYNFDFMAISCETISKINFYHSNGTYTGKSLTTLQNPMYINFDSKGRLVILSRYQISVHY